MNKIKAFIESEQGKDVLTVFIVIFVGIGSFLLGRLSKQEASTGLQIEYANEKGEYESLAPKNIENLQTASAAASVTDKNYFASTRGSKYYSIGCSAGKTIKEENRIYFKTSEDAERAGYALSGSCN